MIRLCFMLFLWVWVHTAQADTVPPILPALYAVTGVANDDKLNVRSAPDGTAAVVHQLAHDATDIQVVQLSLEGNWAYVSQGERSGWVARRFLAPTPSETDSYGLPVSLTCFGTEPFWAIAFKPKGLQIITPQDAQIFPITTPGFLPQDAQIGRFGYRFTWMEGNTAVRAYILPGLCSDGMSDAVYGLHYVDTRTQNAGCCSL